MSRPALLTAILVLAFLGLVDTAYLVYSAFTHTALACGLDAIDGCNIVAQSEYSRLFGLPLALYGFVFYIVLFVLAAILVVRSHRHLYYGTFAVALIGILSSVYFIVLQIFFIKAFCIYCIGSFVIALLIFLCSIWLLRKHAPPRALRPEVPV